MRNESHKTRITVIREHVTAWRKAEEKSREAVALQIVETHNAINGQAATGIHFESTGDAFTAAKTFADRIFRWLDDETKDTNFMPANFETSILLAMPLARRMACVDELLRPLGLATRGIGDVCEVEFNVGLELRDMLKEDSESHQAVAALMTTPSLAALEHADKELTESIETQIRARGRIEAAIAKAKGGMQWVVSMGRASV